MLLLFSPASGVVNFLRRHDTPPGLSIRIRLHEQFSLYCFNSLMVACASRITPLDANEGHTILGGEIEVGRRVQPGQRSYPQSRWPKDTAQ